MSFFRVIRAREKGLVEISAVFTCVNSSVMSKWEEVKNITGVYWSWTQNSTFKNVRIVFGSRRIASGAELGLYLPIEKHSWLISRSVSKWTFLTLLRHGSCISWRRRDMLILLHFTTIERRNLASSNTSWIWYADRSMYRGCANI